MLFGTKNVLLYMIICFFAINFVSCGNEKKEYVNALFDREMTPSMVTDSVTEMISDSGIIRYKMVTPRWEVYDKASDPHWYFPKGIFVVQFDTTFAESVTIKADTAWNYTGQKLWKLKGNVFVRNIQDETFESQELYWDEKKEKVYSHLYIEINRPEKLMLRGYGFESNQQMTQYVIQRPHSSEFYVEEGKEPVRQSPDSLVTDTIGVVK